MPPAGRFLWWERTRSQGRRKPGELRSGLHPLDLEDGWLEVAEPVRYAEVMADRRAVLQGEQRELVFVADAASHAAQAELLDLALSHLAARHPSRFALTGTGADRIFQSIAEGLSWSLVEYDDAPLLLLGQIVQEDLCIMREEPSGVEGGAPRHVFAAGVVTDSFDPVEKHLLPMLDLHGPVPQYAVDLHESMGRVFETLRKPVWRANFGLAEWREEGQEADVATLLERLYLKVEFETLRRLPFNTDYLLFTVRQHFDPLAALSLEPLACAALAMEIRNLPQALLEYKGVGEPATQQVALAFLDSVCSKHGLQPPAAPDGREPWERDP